MEGRGGLSGNVAEEAFCLKSALPGSSDCLLAAEVKKAGRASEATCITPRPPSLIVREA